LQSTINAAEIIPIPESTDTCKASIVHPATTSRASVANRQPIRPLTMAHLADGGNLQAIATTILAVFS
jgi:hypothetical protein